MLFSIFYILIEQQQQQVNSLIIDDTICNTILNLKLIE